MKKNKTHSNNSSQTQQRLLTIKNKITKNNYYTRSYKQKQLKTPKKLKLVKQKPDTHIDQFGKKKPYH